MSGLRSGCRSGLGSGCRFFFLDVDSEVVLAVHTGVVLLMEA